MAGGVISTAQIFALTIRESANDGSDFTNPAADYRRFFLGEDGVLHLKDSAGTVTSLGGSVATDSIWDAAGDLAVGSGANTAARLAIGATNGMAVQRVSGAVAWALPPGYEFDYVQKTSTTSVTATTEGTADTVVTGAAVTYDGSTVVIVEFYSPSVRPDAGSAGNSIRVCLYDGSSSIGQIGFVETPAAANSGRTMVARVRITPSAASHTYSIRAFVNTGTGIISAGAGGSAAIYPAFMRITKV